MSHNIFIQSNNLNLCKTFNIGSQILIHILYNLPTWTEVQHLNVGSQISLI